MRTPKPRPAEEEPMTDITTSRTAGTVFSRVATRIGMRPQELPDRVHADGDALARDAAWCVVAVTGGLGLGGPIHRHPRSDRLRAKHAGMRPRDWPADTAHQRWRQCRNAGGAGGRRPGGLGPAGPAASPGRRASPWPIPDADGAADRRTDGDVTDDRHPQGGRRRAAVRRGQPGEAAENAAISPRADRRARRARWYQCAGRP